jgi:hypothetical protein
VFDRWEFLLSVVCAVAVPIFAGGARGAHCVPDKLAIQRSRGCQDAKVRGVEWGWELLAFGC